MDIKLLILSALISVIVMFSRGTAAVSEPDSQSASAQ